MKQRITIDDLNQLSDEQKEQLREWWKPVYGDFFSNGHWANIIQSEEDGSIRCVSTDNDGAYDYESKNECLPLLSIGQMIEIMHARNSSFGNHYIDINWEGELSDALWEEVKIVLKDTPTP